MYWVSYIMGQNFEYVNERNVSMNHRDYCQKLHHSNGGAQQEWLPSKYYTIPTVELNNKSDYHPL